MLMPFMAALAIHFARYIMIFTGLLVVFTTADPSTSMVDIIEVPSTVINALNEGESNVD